MPKLYVLSGPDVGRTFSVRSGDTIGRSPDRILTLRHASVSRVHAHLEEQDGVWYVVDDGSQNGVLVGGERVARAALHDAAEFALGEILLRFRLDAPAAAPAAAPATPPAAPIEDEILLEGPPIAPNEPTRARPRPALVPPPAPPAPPAPRAPAQASARGLSNGVPKVLQYHRIEDRGGFAASDLTQHPTWLRVLIVVCVLALGAAIAYFAFRGAIFVKGEVGGAP